MQFVRQSYKVVKVSVGNRVLEIMYGGEDILNGVTIPETPSRKAWVKQNLSF